MGKVIKIGREEWWKNRLDRLADSHSFDLGYKLLCCPWETVGSASYAFISTNPGAATPIDAVLKCTSEERGNSYLLERDTTRSPITEQFIKLLELLDINPKQILTGFAHPFRSGAWDDFNKEQKEIGLKLGIDFWRAALAEGNIKKVIISGTNLSENIAKHLDAKIEMKIPSGWNPTYLTKYVSTNDTEIIVLPHLSRFKLFSRAQCYEPLRQIFGL